MFRAKKYEICPTEKRCGDYKNGGEAACSRCPKNLGFVEEIQDSPSEPPRWIEVDDVQLAVFGDWVNYLISLYTRFKYFRLDDGSLTKDEVDGLMMVEAAVIEANETIQHVKEGEWKDGQNR